MHPSRVVETRPATRREGIELHNQTVFLFLRLVFPLVLLLSLPPSLVLLSSSPILFSSCIFPMCPLVFRILQLQRERTTLSSISESI